MVRRHLTVAGSVLLGAIAVACGRDMDMPETVEMRDTSSVMRALASPAAMDSMLDSMPGGEMARGDSTAATQLLRDKIGN